MNSIAAIANQAHGALSIDTIEVRGLRPDQVLIENRAAGLCHSDLNILEGQTIRNFPIILGHEGAGIVLECGSSVTGLKPGDHVVTCLVGECGHCPRCKSQRTNLCERSEVKEALFTGYGVSPHFSRDGQPLTVLAQGATFANHTIVQEIYATKIPSTIPFEVACLFGCAVITGIGAALFTAQVEENSSVIVFGLGGIGLNVIEGARLAGARMIIGVDNNPAKETIARQFGLTDFVLGPRPGVELISLLTDMTSGGADYAFECAGNSRLGEIAFQSTRLEWGKTVMIGSVPNTDPLMIPTKSLLTGRTILGSMFGNAKPRSEITHIADLYAAGKLHTERLISHRLPLRQINEGFSLLRRGECVRAVVEFA